MYMVVCTLIIGMTFSKVNAGKGIYHYSHTCQTGGKIATLIKRTEMTVGEEVRAFLQFKALLLIPPFSCGKDCFIAGA